MPHSAPDAVVGIIQRKCGADSVYLLEGCGKTLT